VKFLNRLGQLFFLRILGLALIFLQNIVIARLIGSGGYGIYSYAVSSATVLAKVGSMGWPTASMRFVGQYSEQQDWKRFSGVLLRASQLTLLGTLAVSVVLSALVFWTDLSKDLSSSLLICALIVPLIGLVSLRRATFQGLGLVNRGVVAEDVLRPLLVVIPLVVFAPNSIFGIIAVYLASAIVVLVVASLLLVKSLPPESRSAIRCYETGHWISIARRMVIGGMAFIVLNRSGILMLGVLDDMQAVGVFSAAMRMAALMGLVLGCVEGVITPALTSAFYGKRKSEFFAVMRKAIRIGILGGVPPLVFLMLFPAQLLGLFGNEFLEAVPILRLLAFGQFVNVATGPVGFALILTGHEGTVAKATGTVLGLSIVGYLMMIPALGAFGAAIITCFAQVTLNLTLVGLVFLRLRLHSW